MAQVRTSIPTSLRCVPMDRLPRAFAKIIRHQLNTYACCVWELDAAFLCISCSQTSAQFTVTVVPDNRSPIVRNVDAEEVSMSMQYCLVVTYWTLMWNVRPNAVKPALEHHAWLPSLFLRSSAAMCQSRQRYICSTVTRH